MLAITIGLLCMQAGPPSAYNNEVSITHYRNDEVPFQKCAIRMHETIGDINNVGHDMWIVPALSNAMCCINDTLYLCDDEAP